jgi:hypothetical protein
MFDLALNNRGTASSITVRALRGKLSHSFPTTWREAVGLMIIDVYLRLLVTQWWLVKPGFEKLFF